MDQVIEEKNYLSLTDTNVLKGFAICLMLWHHLFISHNDALYSDIHIVGEYYLVNQIGIMTKVCVTIFLFLSGYGLMIQAENKGIGRLKDFYLRRFRKLFLNYWFVWLIFVPISYFCFDMTFEKAYRQNVTLQLASDVMGIHHLFFPTKMPSYNPTWWFYSCIVVCYLCFPWMYKIMKKERIWMLMFVFVISFYPLPFGLRFNVLAFSLGMCMAVLKNTPPIPISIGVFLVILYLAIRNMNQYPVMIDCLLTPLLVYLYQCLRIPSFLKKSLAFLGKHSMNIFLFHTFIFYFWFQNFVYSSRNPVIIFLTLLAICLPISIALEWIKKYTIYKLWID